MNFFKRLFCRHEGKLEHVCDVYGDKIFPLPRRTRSVWQCPKCGKYVYKEYLGKDLRDVDNIGNACVGLTAREMKLSMKKMRQKGWH